jgi:hypothetical protein
VGEREGESGGRQRERVEGGGMALGSRLGVALG